MKNCEFKIKLNNKRQGIRQRVASALLFSGLLRSFPEALLTPKKPNSKILLHIGITPALLLIVGITLIYSAKNFGSPKKHIKSSHPERSCISFCLDRINTNGRFSQGNYSDEEIANAIFKAENSKRYPYGIKSINTHGNKEYARKICLNTIKNNRKRFVKQTQYKNFIEFLGSRYCPITIKSEYHLNKNWVKNVTYFLVKAEGNQKEEE